MILIRKLVQKTMAVGYLTVEVEEQLRSLFKCSSSLEDIEALSCLQQAVESGSVKRR